jgi:hypothetical protein
VPLAVHFRYEPAGACSRRQILVAGAATMQQRGAARLALTRALGFTR